MKIWRDKKNRKLTLSLANYIEKLLQCLFMENVKNVSTILHGHLMLTKEICPKTQEEEEKMSKVPYALVVGILMYAMVCIRLDIAHAMGVVSRYDSSRNGALECS